MEPPTTLMTTASTRNCSRTSEPRAPIARRRPISRVRSVTDTSMMFMMPMPPTTQRHARDAREQRRHRLRRLRAHRDHVVLRLHPEVVVVARLDLVHRCAAAVDERVGRHGASRRRTRADEDVVQELRALQLLHHRRVRREDLVVLILAARGRALGLHHAEHVEDLVADAELRARRVHVRAEQVLGDVDAERADLRRAAHVVRR